MQDVKYYEQGRVPGDALWVLNSIEHQREWAIVLDHTDAGNYFNPAGPNWQVFVNGVLVSTCDSRWEAGLVMQDYLDGACWIPGLPRSSHRRRRRRRVRLARATG
ncbi:MAG: hypothetical protein ACRDJH_09180 [Thermomicrobiales bacterium]